MGKQKAHRRQAREAKEQARQQTGIEVLNVVKDQLPADPPAAVTSLALVPTPTPAPVGAKKEPTPTSVAAPAKTVAKPQSSVYRRPVWEIYRDYFRGCLAVYQHNERLGLQCDLKGALEGKSQGRYPLPMGFVPGGLVTLGFRLNGEVQYQIVQATTDVKDVDAERGRGFPTPWRLLKEMPKWLGQAVGVHLALIESIGGEPTSWNLGVVRTFRKERINPGTLRLGFSQFQYPGYEAKPFGCCLVPELGTGGLKGFRLTKVYNPGRLPGVPTEGTLLSLEFLNGQGPIQKLLNTWVGMEDNFQWYVKNPDKPKPFVKPEPNQRR